MFSGIDRSVIGYCSRTVISSIFSHSVFPVRCVVERAKCRINRLRVISKVHVKRTEYCECNAYLYFGLSSSMEVQLFFQMSRSAVLGLVLFFQLELNVGPTKKVGRAVNDISNIGSAGIQANNVGNDGVLSNTSFEL